MEAPAERYAYVAALASDQKSHGDALLVIDVDPASQSYGEVAGRLDLPSIGDELQRLSRRALIVYSFSID
jgi:selenium-binding protein 1